jgi:hypothetical protein
MDTDFYFWFFLFCGILLALPSIWLYEHRRKGK